MAGKEGLRAGREAAGGLRVCNGLGSFPKAHCMPHTLYTHTHLQTNWWWRRKPRDLEGGGRSRRNRDKKNVPVTTLDLL